jgi:hypothetical protein
LSKQDILTKIDELLFSTELDYELLKNLVQDYNPETATPKKSESFLNKASEVLSQENAEKYNLDEEEVEDLLRAIEGLVPESHIVSMTYRINSEDEEDAFEDFLDSKKEQMANAVGYLHEEYGVPKEKIKKDIEELFDQDLDLNDIVEILDDKYKMNPDDDTSSGPLIGDFAGAAIIPDQKDRVFHPELPTDLAGGPIHQNPMFLSSPPGGEEIFAKTINALVKLADHLDRKNLTKEADMIDLIIKKLSK